MRLLLLFTLFICFSTSASQFTKIGNISVKQGSRASSVKSLVGSVSNNGNFAIATFKPASVKGLGRAIARGNPYAIAALTALDFFNDNGQWMKPASLTGDIPSESPKITDSWQADCSASSHSSVVSGTGDFVPSTARQMCAEQSKDDVLTYWQPQQNTTGALNCEWSVSIGNVENVSYTVKPKLDCDGGFYDRQASFAVTVSNDQETTTLECPPDSAPQNVIQYDKSGDGDTDACVTPQSLEDYSPQQTTVDDIAPVYADDMQEWFNQSIDNLQDWSPFSDGTATGLEPEYIESYNQADVSPTFNEYLKRVASGSYQTIDQNASDYVPLDMVNPAEVAITSLKNGDSFVDPTTGEIKDVDNKTDGASSEQPSSTVPDGTAANPINVTVNLPEDDTISQTEYEESNQKDYDDFDTEAQLQKTNIDTVVTDLEASDQSFIDSLIPDVQNVDVPEMPSFSSLFPDLPFGTCTAFSVDTMQGTVIKPMVFDSHCAPYQTYLHPLIYWFLYVMTGLYIFHLAGETFNRN
jgi:hypothetical protein